MTLCDRKMTCCVREMTFCDIKMTLGDRNMTLCDILMTFSEWKMTFYDQGMIFYDLVIHCASGLWFSASGNWQYATGKWQCATGKRHSKTGIWQYFDRKMTLCNIEMACCVLLICAWDCRYHFHTRCYFQYSHTYVPQFFSQNSTRVRPSIVLESTFLISKCCANHL